MELLERSEDIEEENESDEEENYFSYSPPSPPNEPQPRIVIFREQIYTLVPYSSDLWFGTDYYASKISKNKKDSRLTKLSIQYDEKTMNFYGIRDHDSRKKEMFIEFQKNAVDITGKTAAEINVEHMNLLRKRVLRKVIDIPTREEITEREEYHRSQISTEIREFIEEISPKLYAAAEEGHNSVSWCFKHFNESRITMFGKYPQLAKAPCLDGKFRNFRDYIFYLAEKLYERHADETDDVLWFGSQVTAEVRNVFPHLTVDAGAVEKGAIFPQIRVTFMVDRDKLLH